MVFEQTRLNDVVLPYMDTSRVDWTVYFASQCNDVEPQICDRLLSMLETADQIMQVVQWQMLASNARLRCDTLAAHDARDKSIYPLV